MLRAVTLSSVLVGLAVAVSLQAARAGTATPETTGRAAAAPAQQAALAAPAVEWQRALLDRYCVGCHNDRTRTGELSLQTVALDQVGHAAHETAVWEKVVQKLRAQSMPPAGR